MAEFDPDDLAEWSGGRWVRAVPDRVSGVSGDTRTIEPGNLYFALKGDRFDGHDFVADAFEKGAAAAVVGSDWAAGAQSDQEAPAGPLLAVENTRRALMDIAAGHRRKTDPDIVGVTGSVGKSTVKEMTARMLGASMSTASTKGNWNNDVGLPLSILEMERSTRVGVFEVGTNHPGEIARLCEVLGPTSGVVTNVGPVHIEHFGSVEAVAREKGSLLACLPGSGFAVLDSSGDFFGLLRSMCTGRVITVGWDSDDDYACLRSDSAGGEFTVVEKSSGEEATMRTPVPGSHNIMNAVFATAVARTYGIQWSDMRDALADYEPLPMRWERLRVKWNGGPVVNVVNDAYNANPVSMRASIRALGEQEAKGRNWLVLGDMLELGATAKAEHRALGAFVAGTVARAPGMWGGLVTVGELGRAIAAGATAEGMPECSVVWCAGKREVRETLADRLSSDDNVLLKASRLMSLEEIVEGMEEQ